MNSKSFSLFALTVFAFVFVIGATSATSSSTNGTAFTLQNINVPASIAQSTGSFTITFDINNVGAASTVDFIPGSTISNAVYSSFSPTNGTFLGSGVNSVTVVVSFNSSSNVTISGNIIARSSSGTPATLSFSVPVISDVPPEVASCLGTGNSGQLKINAIDFTNNGLKDTSNTTFGDDNTWFPFENINTKVDVKNLGTQDVSNIEVDWGIWDTQKMHWVVVPSELKNIDLSNGKTKTMFQSFSIDNNMDVDLSDLTNGNHYQFYAIASGEISNATSNPTCAYKAQSAGISIESDFVTFRKINVPATAQCGQNVQITGELWNIGNNDQNSVSVDIIGSDNSLQLSKNVIAGDINAFDNKQFSFSFSVPKSTDEKTYGIKLNVLDENGNTFQESTNDHNSEFLMPITVSGGCTPQVSLIGSVISGGEAGKPLVVKATVINSGTVTKTYTVNAADFQSWASSASVDQRTIILNPGASKDVSVTLNTNSDASGTQTFSLNLASESGQTITTQPVSVNLSKSQGFSFSNASMWIWVLGALILILVIVIIIVALRVGKRNSGSVKK